MAKYVDVEKAFCRDCESRVKCVNDGTVWCDVLEMEGENVQPVRHAKWEGRSVYGVWCYECSACGEPKPPMGKNLYCNCCGALMEEE